MAATRGEKTVVITGGNAGLGFECARGVSASGRGWRVVLACRDREKGERAARELNGEFGDGRVEAMVLDLASLASVRAFARGLRARISTGEMPPLRALLCNAGIQVVTGTTYTEDGFEETFGVNHLGHFLLVNLLLGDLEAPARIVLVSSGTHDPAQRTGMPPGPRWREPEMLAWPERYPATPGENPSTTGRRRYSASKLANVLTAYELSRRLETTSGAGDREAPVTVNLYDPGLMPGSGLARDYGAAQRFAWRYVFPALRLFVPNVNSTGASGRVLAQLVSEPRFGGVTGKYFVGHEAQRSSDESYDREKAAELWEASARLVSLRPEETILRVETPASGA
ncbi:MAG: SDR family NAD(P)-dependent oxidoreductase [Actinomycetota bacterium]|jgi:light-dependent protochlorophyllide reductase|nr:SDR family NAD(P)-dependent oxidoreductase [Rubrobacteraceae bacterium]MDQ3316739.1 SDR family NAD(P)-dependent oxidoreductase [Actinomycetota bacterium]MDQ3429063.1 SDR family NAD(P)-dependent oxidoreductase [Actinomycetota bacterium]